MFRVCVVLFVMSLITACGGGGSGGSGISRVSLSDGAFSSNVGDNVRSSSEAPFVGRILTDIRHFSKSYGGTVYTGDVQTIAFMVNVEVSDPQGFDDIDFVYFYKTDGEDGAWDLYEAGVYSDCQVQSSNLFECVFYDPLNLHSIDLEDWEMSVVDKSGNEARQAFRFELAGGVVADVEQFVYSPYYTGSTEFGETALQSLSEIDDDVYAFKRDGSQSFEFRFTASDSRVREYGFELWSFDGTWTYIGAIRPNSPSIESTALVNGLETRVSIPWSEITLRDGYSPADVDGIHVLLYDEVIDISEGSGWTNHIGVSEFILMDARVDPDL